MAVVSGEDQCEEIVERTRQQCPNKSFAKIDYGEIAIRLHLCRLHFSIQAATFPPENKYIITAEDPEDQKEAEELVKFLRKKD